MGRGPRLPFPRTDVMSMTADEIRAEAERRRRRREKGLPIEDTPAEKEQYAREEDDRLEREIQRDVVRLYRAHGCVVYETSQRRAAKVSPGIPDLIVMHTGARVQFYHEVKTPSGKLRPDQKDFRDQCLASGTVHIVGGVAAAERQLDAIGVRADGNHPTTQKVNNDRPTRSCAL